MLCYYVGNVSTTSRVAKIESNYPSRRVHPKRRDIHLSQQQKPVIRFGLIFLAKFFHKIKLKMNIIGRRISKKKLVDQKLYI